MNRSHLQNISLTKNFTETGDRVGQAYFISPVSPFPSPWNNSWEIYLTPAESTNRYETYYLTVLWLILFYFLATAPIIRVKYDVLVLLEQGRKHLFFDCATVLQECVMSLTPLPSLLFSMLNIHNFFPIPGWYWSQILLSYCLGFSNWCHLTNTNLEIRHPTLKTTHPVWSILEKMIEIITCLNLYTPTLL